MAMRDGARAPSSSDFGTLLRHYRLAAGLSQEALAERARMSTNGIGALERGYRRTPQRETLALLADALSLDDEQRQAFEAAAARSGAQRRPGGASVTVGPWAGAGTSILPIALTSFVGREAQLDEIGALMRDHRLVTITGSGGVGKTQTALRAAEECSEVAEDSVRFIALAAVANPSLVPSAVASVVGAQELPNRSALQALVAYLRNKALLLILDNCEHVIAEAAIVADALLASCPHIRILATSREPLRAAGERTYRLPSLSVGEGAALFADRARAVDHRFTLTDQNAPTIAELCGRLDGIPLAIELAAARANLLSVEALTERLGERFRILTGGKRTALPRQQTMRAAIDWSYDLLSAQERRLFERLSVFAGGCTLEAVEGVAPGDDLEPDDVFDLLSSLAEKSLVIVDHDRGSRSRYRLLESTRAFALEKLAERGDRAALARRHAAWIADVGDRATATTFAKPIETWVGEFEPELENARSAIDWAIESGELSLAARIACGFTGVWHMSRGHSEPRRWLELLLSRIDAATCPRTAARMWHMLSTVTFGAHSVEAAERALELDADDRPDRKMAILHQMGVGLLQAGRVDEAEAANERVLQLCEENGLTRSRRYAAALGLRAHIAVVRDRLDEARHSYGRALSLMTALGEETEASIFRIALGELEYRTDRVEQALEFADAAVAASRRVRSRHREANALVNSAAYRLTLGDIDGARAGAREALALSAWASPIEVAAAIQHSATVEALRGDARRGARLLGYVDAWYRSEGSERDVTEGRTYEILVAALRKNLTEAEIEGLAAEGAQLSDEQAVTQALGV